MKHNVGIKEFIIVTQTLETIYEQFFIITDSYFIRTGE